MLSICRAIFLSGKDVISDSGLFVAKVITALKTKGMYASYMIKKQCYWPKGVPGDLIDTHFRDKKVGDVGTIETRTEDKTLFKRFRME